MTDSFADIGIGDSAFEDVGVFPLEAVLAILSANFLA